MKTLVSDAVILDNIKAGGARRQKAIAMIYEE